MARNDYGNLLTRSRSARKVHLMQVTYTYSDDDLVSIGVAARILGVTVGTVRRWEAAGHLAARRTPGKQRRFLVGDLRSLLAGAA